MSYPSDLTDKQWQKLACFFERPDPRGARSRYPSLESFTADTAYKRQAERVAREVLGIELHITAKPKRPKLSHCRIQKEAASNPLPSAGGPNALSRGSNNAGSSAKSTKKRSQVLRHGSGAR